MKFKTLKVVNQQVNLREICDTVLKLLERKAKQKKIQLLCNIDEKIPEFIISDNNRIRQILLNLVGNSLKFTKKGFIKIVIERVQNQQIEAH